MVELVVLLMVVEGGGPGLPKLQRWSAEGRMIEVESSGGGAVDFMLQSRR